MNIAVGCRSALCLALLAALAAPGCAGDPSASAAAPGASSAAVSGSGQRACADTGDYDRKGNASWYGEGYHGKRTASGKTFDMDGLTAAHPSLPFGSRIRVTNLRNSRSVTLTVTDRGPFTGGRIVDVSRRAAQELDFVNAGVAPVRVRAIGC